MKTLKTLLILLTTTIMMAQNTPQPSVDVTGEGIVHVVPDQVTINVRVENNGKNAKELKQLNDSTVNDVLATIKRMGIDDKDVRTEYIRLDKNYDYNTKTYSFAANQAISIKVKDLSKYEPLMNALLESGINRIDGIAFSSSNQDALESQARKKAVENAQIKAKEYAAVLNQSIGKAISISEFSQQSGPQPMYKVMAMESDMGGGQQTIAPGEIEIKMRVNVSFVLN